MAVLVVAFALACGCSMNSGNASSFEYEILTIENEVGHLTSLFSLFRVDSFVRIFEDPSSRVAEAECAIRSQRLGEQAKVIVVLSMQRLPKREYVQFLQHVYEEWLSGELSDNVLTFAFVPGYSWNTVLVADYDAPYVASFLDEMAKNERLPEELMQWMELTRSGQAAKALEELRAAGLIYNLPHDFRK